MKKYIFILLAALTFVACNNDEEINGYKDIQPIKESEIPLEIVEFFNIQENYVINYHLSYFEFTSPCYIINNQKELKNIYWGSKDLPQIDFSKYSLIMGVTRFPDGRYYIGGKKIKESDNNLMVDITIKKGDCGIAGICWAFFWGLYPKSTSKSLNVNLINEDGTPFVFPQTSFDTLMKVPFE